MASNSGQNRKAWRRLMTCWKKASKSTKRTKKKEKRRMEEINWNLQPLRCSKDRSKARGRESISKVGVKDQPHGINRAEGDYVNKWLQTYKLPYIIKVLRVSFAKVTPSSQWNSLIWVSFCLTDLIYIGLSARVPPRLLCICFYLEDLWNT